MNSSRNNRFEQPELTVADLSKSLYELSLRLQDANTKLRQQETERLEFYAHISHDLRAPITAISNAISLLEDDIPLSQKDYEATIKLLRNRTDYMAQLINDIFLLSSLESSTEKYHPEPVDFCFFIEDYYYMCEADSAFKDCKLSLELDPALLEKGPIINLDPHLLHSVLDNLFTNAVKYSNSTPTISLGARLLDEHTISFYVKDCGIGIKEEDIPHIFERSFRVDKSRTPGSDNSSGFGLSIVKAIIELHQGTVTCQSILGEGSCFSITLPI